ncbi:MAG: hypothetical protein K6E50_01880 [Lachnospiraceae bacterium]|nr:hypothetical protein [Lachnospiraceae bacterium]
MDGSEKQYRVVYGDELLAKDGKSSEELYRVFLADQEVYSWEPDYIGRFSNMEERHKAFPKSFVCLFDGDELAAYICFFPVDDEIWARIQGDEEKVIYESGLEVIPDDDITGEHIAKDRNAEKGYTIVSDGEGKCRIRGLDEEKQEKWRDFEARGGLRLFIISVAARKKYRNEDPQITTKLIEAWIAYLNAIQRACSASIESIAAVTVSDGGRSFMRSCLFSLKRVCADHKEREECSQIYQCEGDRLSRLLEGQFYRKEYRDDIFVLLPFQAPKKSNRLEHIPEEYEERGEELGDESLPDYFTIFDAGQGEKRGHSLYSRFLLQKLRYSRDFECSNDVSREVTEHYLGSFQFLHTLDDYCDETEADYGEAPTIVGEDTVELSLLVHNQTHMYILLMLFPNCRYSTSQLFDQVSKNYLKIRAEGWNVSEDDEGDIRLDSWEELGMFRADPPEEISGEIEEKKKEYRKQLILKEIDKQFLKELEEAEALELARILQKFGKEYEKLYTMSREERKAFLEGNGEKDESKKIVGEKGKSREEAAAKRKEIEAKKKAYDEALRAGQALLDQQKAAIGDFAKREKLCLKYIKGLEETNRRKEELLTARRESRELFWRQTYLKKLISISRQNDSDELFERAVNCRRRAGILRRLAELPESELKKVLKTGRFADGEKPDEGQTEFFHRILDKVEHLEKVRKKELSDLHKEGRLSYGCHHYMHINDYLHAMYGLEKAGEGKALTCMTQEIRPQPGEEWVYEGTNRISRELMNILSGETYFSLFQNFRICNKELIEMATNDVSAYDYYTAYMSEHTVVFKLEESVLDKMPPEEDFLFRYRVDDDTKEHLVLTRMGLAATELFIMQLVMFQNTALAKMTERVSKALAKEGKVPWEYINRLYEEYGKTIHFWKTDNFKYYGTSLEARHLREAFSNDELKAVYAEQQEYLQKLVEINNAEQERRNGLVINIVGIILAVVQIKGDIVEGIQMLYKKMPMEWLVPGTAQNMEDAVDAAAEAAAKNSFNVLGIGIIILVVVLMHLLNRRSLYHRMKDLKRIGATADELTDDAEAWKK